MKTTRRNFIGSIAAGGAYAALPGGFAVAADASGRALPVPADAQKRRANADWLKGSVGVSSHWTNNTRRLDGAKPAFSDAVDGFDVAGKTSTAEIFDEENGGYRVGIYNLAFCGFIDTVPDAPNCSCSAATSTIVTRVAPTSISTVSPSAA